MQLLGIDAAGTPRADGPPCDTTAATARTRELVEGQLVRLEFDPAFNEQDQLGHKLAYVWLADGRMFNELLAEDGYARPLTIAPNDDYARVFAAASGRARAALRGLWGRCPAR